MKSTILLAVIIISSMFCLANASDEPLYGPAIENYGPYFTIENKDVELPKDHQYKVVFDVKRSSDDKSQHNRHIESVARFMNMHAANGVATGNMNIAVVLHGASARDTLNNSAYNKRYGLDNPNIALIKVLNDKGVKFYLCGQSAAFGGIEKPELLPQVKLALSAMTMLTLLQQDGYAILP